ncbi:phosphate/phosphite/phosphonate ABC transporter substrate-binding protein [Alkalicoccus chagannorensis]|uniref:phosphate/phosphite/phosphonate ABC transporter substrate-binding protein n=1 Tax=Alkalicoccus chagannorensis TaxID=427072 RepID=UPI0004791BD0|nr:phosphate/phosphite/phosphonate ABC transporter substrate-binding protein [Alkalicoccus chagannorensis]
MKAWWMMAGAALVLSACGSEDNSGAEEEDPEEIVMGFVPTTDSDEIASTVEPLAERLSEILDRPVEGTVMTSFSGLVAAMGNGEAHIGFLPAFGYVQGNEEYDLEVMLKSERDGASSYRAQFVVREDAGLETLDDLEGTGWTFPDVASPAGYLFPAAHIAEHRGDIGDVETEFFGDVLESGSHDNALTAVIEGEMDVATTYEDARDVILDDYPEAEEELKVIEYTDEIPNDTISVMDGLDEGLKEEIKEAFLQFNEEEEMIQVMNDVYRWDAIVEAEDSDYDIVRETYDNFRDEIDVDDL